MPLQNGTTLASEEKNDDNSIKFGRILANPPPGEEIVISGVSGRYPDSENVHHFRDNLFEKVDMVSGDTRRWEPTHPGIPQRTGKIPLIEKFDAGFFGVHHRQATSMDPMNRVLLEKVMEAIFDAGINPSDLENTNTGVFIGACFSENERTWFNENLLPKTYAITGCERSMLANRISYFLKLNGPSFVCDTACSSSLYAFEHAYKAMRAGQCERAIVGCSNLCLHPFVSLQFARLGVLSMEGMCKTFDNSGNGYVRSEAMCAVILERSKDAKRNYSTVVHAKTNCDGYKDSGITYPSGKMQVRLLQEFYQECQGVKPSELSFIEAHGTGTKVGDPEECAAIDEVFLKGRKKPLLVGSVKSNIGHSEPSSGLCSITKVIIGLETGFIPPNLHYTAPRKGLKALEDGRLQVVTEKMPFQDKRGLIGINSFGFGGGNCHVLLEHNKKEKINGGKAVDGLPRIVCVSGRTDDAVQTLLDDVIANQTDVEHVRLLQEVFRKEIVGHLYRGYSVLSGEKELVRSSKCYLGLKPSLYIAFGEMDRDIQVVAKKLLEMPMFAETIHKVHEILSPKGRNIIDIISKTNDTSVLNNILVNISVQLGIADILKGLEIEPNGIFGFGLGEIICGYFDGALTLKEAIDCSYLIACSVKDLEETSVCYMVTMDEKQLNQTLPEGIDVVAINSDKNTIISGSVQAFNRFFDSLKTNGINAQQISTKIINFKNLKFPKTKNQLINELSKILSKPKQLSKKCIINSLKPVTGEHLVNSLVNIVNFKGVTRKLEKDLVILEIGNGLVQKVFQTVLRKNADLLSFKDVNNMTGFLGIIGSLYERGCNPQVQKLYPKVEFPVSRGTPMINSKIKWNHNKDWFVTKYACKISENEKKVTVLLKDPSYTFVGGHLVDGRNLFPATGYLLLAWEAFSQTSALTMTDTQVVFENCKFRRACSLTSDENCLLEFTVMLQQGTGNFEVIEGGMAVVTGRIHLSNDFQNEQSNVPRPKGVDTSEVLALKKKDIYKELRLRGYNYKGEFRALETCDNSAQTGKIRWTGNWVTFMDNMLQMKILQEDTRLLYVPTSIARLCIDGPRHIKYAQQFDEENPAIPVWISKETGIIRSGGIEIRGLTASSIARRKYLGTPVLERYEFVPNEATISIHQSLRVNMQIALENAHGIKVKAVELIDEATEEKAQPLGPMIHEVLGDQPLIQADIKILSKNPLDVKYVKVEDNKLLTETECMLVVGSKILQRTPVLNLVFGSLKEHGFALSREPLDFDIFNLNVKEIDILTIHTLEEEKIVFFRKKTESTAPILINASVETKGFNWLSDLQAAVKKDASVIVYTQNEPLSGVLGLVNCARREPGGNNIRCVFILAKDVPKFDPSIPFYRKQLDKNMAINVYKDGKWGTYRHLLLENIEEVEAEHCYVNSTLRGDLSSLKWLEGGLKSDVPLESERTLIYVYYSALNFRDVMTASGKINVDVITRDRRTQECVQGFEFAGRIKSGKRVMGMLTHGALSTIIDADMYLMWDIPEAWSLEDAATVPVVYGTCYYALIVRGNMKRGDTVLIHSGSGGIGQAAITIALHYGCKVYTTVGTKEKRDFLKKRFPQLTDRHIANSRDTTFEQHVIKETNGRGVDIVLNSLAEEKLLASVRCLATGGRFIEIGKFDLASDNPLSLLLFQKEASFHGVMLDQLITESPGVKMAINRKLTEGIQNGIVKPLSRTVFKEDEIEKAFRFMASGKHIGKVLIQLRKEEKKQIVTPQKKMYKGIPRYYCEENKTYIICGGLGGFGLELADWLVLRGARKLVLTSRTGVKTGYQDYRISIWRSYGCTVVVSTADITKKQGCETLIDEANQLGPVGGLFNLAVVLKDSILKNQTIETFQISFGPKADATQYLDEVTRRRCPELRDFVIFSSVSCGRGNPGQTNYGMANSVMERICEKRKSEGYPALAIEWGAIGEVGLVAEMQEEHFEMAIGGTLQQRISNCLQVLDIFLKQKEASVVSSIVVAEKRAGAGGADNAVDAVANILGLKDLKTISLNATLAELGMDSMTAVEIKQTLEREFEIFLNANDIKSMTFAKLIEIQTKKDTDAQGGIKTDMALGGMDMVFRLLGDESTANTPFMRLKSKISESTTKIILFPGIEGVATVLDPLASNLEGELVALQYCLNNQADTIEGMAEAVLSTVKDNISKSRPFYIIAYSFGSMVALECVRILESRGYLGNVIIIDGAPAYMRKLLSLLEYDSEDRFQVSLLIQLLSLQMSFESISKHVEGLFKCNTFEERIEMGKRIVEKNNSTYSPEHQANMGINIYKRVKALMAYKSNFKLKSTITLFKAQFTSIELPEKDFGLSEFSEKPVEVRVFGGNHVTVLKNQEMADAINQIFNPTVNFTQNKNLSEKERPKTDLDVRSKADA